MRVTKCLALAWGLALCTASAAQEAIRQPPITVKIAAVPLRAALKELLAGTTLQYQVDKNVPDLPVTLNVRDVSPRAALEIIVRNLQSQKGAKDLCLSMEGGVLCLKVDPALRAQQLAVEKGMEAERPLPEAIAPSFQDPRLDRKITLSFKNQPLGVVVGAIFSGSGCQYTFTGKCNELRISLDIREVNAQAALRLALRNAAKTRPAIRLWRDGDVYVIGPQVTRPPGNQP